MLREDEYFFLGDNVHISADSALIGRTVLAIIRRERAAALPNIIGPKSRRFTGRHRGGGGLNDGSPVAWASRP